MNYIKITTFIAILSITFITGCDKDPDPVNEEELITTLTMTFTPQGGGAPVIFMFNDLDGDGGDAPEITNAFLTANTTYNVTLELLNESVDPAENITEEVKEEGDHHQIFFQTADSLNITFNYNDVDDDGNPIGLSAAATAGKASQGMLTVTLRHEPNKSASGVKDGNISNAGGETDIEVVFDVVVQ